MRGADIGETSATRGLYSEFSRMPLPPATVPAPGFARDGIDFGEEKPLFKSKLYANTKT